MYVCMYVVIRRPRAHIVHVHYIITINDLARMLKYRVLDRDISKGRHLRRGMRLGSARQN